MNPIIPLHCLVLDAVGASSNFPKHEVLTASGVYADLVGGDNNDTNYPRVVFQEIVRRAAIKLSIGERVVVSATGIDRNHRKLLAKEAQRFGLPAIWLISPENRELARGDDLAEVMKCQTLPVPITANYDLIRIKERYAGVTVIGDVHGAHQSMLAALGWARSRNHFVVLLGDVLDGGIGTLEAVEEAWRMVTRGEAAMLMGNHERKINLWLDGQEGGSSVKLSDGNLITTQALGRLGVDARRRWTVRFRGLWRRAVPLLDFGNVMLAHGAIHRSWWVDPCLNEAVRRYAMFGESDATTKIFKLGYNWVDAIPNDKMVIVGHDTRSIHVPVRMTGRAGGQAIFLDTGSGKGGVLSSADLRFGADGILRLENLNVH